MLKQDKAVHLETDAMPYIVRKKLDGTTAERWEVKDRPVSFGRGDEADVQIKDERMSRQHFAIEPREEKFFLRDLNSTNGTFVNNKPVTEVELQANDRIRSGQTVLVFETDKPKPVATVIGEISKPGKIAPAPTMLGKSQNDPRR